jgi:hypothetical protein
MAIRPPWGTAWYLKHVGPRLRLVANAPVSHADRRSLDFWEVAASAGIPSLSVGWWAAGPWPGAVVVENRAVFARASDGAGADREAIRVFEDEVKKGFGLATVYLPGCDIARGDPPVRKAAEASLVELLKREIARAEAGEIALLVLAADSHPDAGSLGRLVAFDGRPGGRKVRIQAVDVAPSILARAGIPAASDLSGRPVPSLFRPDALESATVPTYGARVAPPPSTAPESDEEYLEKLRSLGYLQ